MPTILSDHDVEGHLDVLLAIWTSPDWRDLWEGLDCRIVSFASLGVRFDLPDSEVWQLCQDRQFVLVTGNRNAETEDSLERTSLRLNQPNSLPIITLADSERVLMDRQYAQRVASQILDYLFDLENLRGTRRLYAP
jgi:hypothetical protein